MKVFWEIIFLVDTGHSIQTSNPQVTRYLSDKDIYGGVADESLG